MAGRHVLRRSSRSEGAVWVVTITAFAKEYTRRQSGKDWMANHFPGCNHMKLNGKFRKHTRALYPLQNR